MKIKKKEKITTIRAGIQRRIKTKQPKVRKIGHNTTDMYKLRNQRDAFLIMVRMTIEQRPEYITELINKWWHIAFPEKQFPQNGGILQKLNNAIQYGLMMQAYIKNDIVIPERFSNNHYIAVNLVTCDAPVKETILDRCENYSNMSKIFINPINKGVYKMNKVKKAKTEVKKIVEKKIVKPNTNKKEKAKTEVKKIVENSDLRMPIAIETEVNKVVKLPAKKGTSKFRRCIELLEQRKFTDEHICSELDMHQKHVVWNRKQLNNGKFISKGYKTPEPPIEKIGGKTKTKIKK